MLKNNLLTLVVLIFFVVNPFKTKAQAVNVQDSLALVDLYNSTNGAGWTKHTNWLTTSPVNSWYGVSVLNDGSTTYLSYISLANNNLIGPIPNSIGNISKLTSLVLSNNKISGSIPFSIGSLLNLTQLSLVSNLLNDTIPSSLGNLSKLNNLSISNNKLTGGIPFSLGNLSNLTYLTFSDNLLNDTIPSSLGNLSKLGYLSMYNNKLIGRIPTTLQNLSLLTTLNLRNNLLSDTIPFTLGNLSNLNVLDLSINQLKGNIPLSLGNLSKLQNLALNQNQLTDSIPFSLGNLANLNYLTLNTNQLTGVIPPSLGNLTKLQFLHLDSNHLSGSIPFSLQNLPNLVQFYTSFYLGNNNLTFSGMEGIAQAYVSRMVSYSPQANIPIFKKGNLLIVSAGGTPTNNTYKWYKDGNIIATKTADSTFSVVAPGNYNVVVTNSVATQLTLFSDTLALLGDSLILPAKPNIEFANLEYTDKLGWTHYYFNNNTPLNITDDTLLLSIKKYGQNIGTIGDGTFTVKLAATANAGTNTGLLLTNPLINNASGYWVMNRFWQVTPTQQPTASVGVRFYYNNQDVADVNGSYPAHNLAKDKLIFYKATGGNPDPTTDLTGATKLIGILPNTYASDTTWTYHILSDTTQYAEYSVASFSGGGGGATGNGKTISTVTATVLPVTLINFTGHLLNNYAALNWQTATETNASFFNIQRSDNGINFSNVGKVAAVGNAITLNNYSFTDASITSNLTYYHRLQSFDKDGSFTHSNIIALKLNGKADFVIFPNPVKQTLFAQIQSSKTTQATITITDLQGRNIQAQQIILNAGSNGLSFDVSNLPSGLYWLVNNFTKQSILFVKQ